MQEDIIILGISSYGHESSACIVKNGEVICLLEEERFNREKHTCQFPEHAIRQCLILADISWDDVDHITFYWTPTKELFGNIKHVLRYFPASLNLLRGGSGSQEMNFKERILSMRSVAEQIRRTFGLNDTPKVHFIEHHLAHAASAFFVSPFEDAAILTIDGRGESTTTLMAHGHGNKIEKLEEVKVPHSLGHLYAAITYYLGFRPFSDEWKVMGLFAYGKDTYVEQMKQIVHLTDNGGFALNLNYFKFHSHGQQQWLSKRFLAEFGPVRVRDAAYEQHHMDMAYALQYVVERAGVHLANAVYKRTGSKNLCMTGGVVLNCLMNKRIVEETPFEQFFFQPVANDAGTSCGSALYHYHQVLGQQRSFVFQSPYLGDGFTNAQIEDTLKREGLVYRKTEDIFGETAAQLADGKIIGWFQGRMEAGPRALGNRSILADPRNNTMKDRLNAKVKKREFFRPFAPSIKAEAVHDYFDMPKKQESPYMILIGDVKPDKRNVIPAITHEDGTARVQTVSREMNERYWKLLSAFESITSVPVLINTSYNENEPIVHTPQEAIACFMRTDFDVLSIGDFIALKSEQVSGT